MPRHARDAAAAAALSWEALEGATGMRFFGARRLAERAPARPYDAEAAHHETH